MTAKELGRKLASCAVQDADVVIYNKQADMFYKVNGIEMCKEFEDATIELVLEVV
jgi:hypothetical protein